MACGIDSSMRVVIKNVGHGNAECLGELEAAIPSGWSADLRSGDAQLGPGIEENDRTAAPAETLKPEEDDRIQ